MIPLRRRRRRPHRHGPEPSDELRRFIRSPRRPGTRIEVGTSRPNAFASESFRRSSVDVTNALLRISDSLAYGATAGTSMGPSTTKRTQAFGAGQEQPRPARYCQDAMSAAVIAPPMCARYYRDKAVTWLWPNRFAIKRLGIIAGLPDEGKGQIISYRCRNFEQGGDAPNLKELCLQAHRQGAGAQIDKRLCRSCRLPCRPRSG
jgi:hypothetical protein